MTQDIKQLIERAKGYSIAGVQPQVVSDLIADLERLTQPVGVEPVGFALTDTTNSETCAMLVGDPELAPFINHPEAFPNIVVKPLCYAETVARLQAQVDAAIKDAGEISEQWVKAQAERDELVKVLHANKDLSDPECPLSAALAKIGANDSSSIEGRG